MKINNSFSRENIKQILQFMCEYKMYIVYIKCWCVHTISEGYEKLWLTKEVCCTVWQFAAMEVVLSNRKFEHCLLCQQELKLGSELVGEFN